MLRVDFANSQKRSVYCLGLSYDNPGHGYIAFIVPTATARPHREFFTVLPSGFYFQHEVHILWASEQSCTPFAVMQQ